MIAILIFVFLLMVIFLFGCVIMLLFQNFQPVYLADLAEFSSLEPTVKRFYKQYFVDIIWKAFMDKYNALLIANGHPKYLLDNEASIRAQCHAIAQWIRDIKNDSDGSQLLSIITSASTLGNHPTGVEEEYEEVEGFDAPKLREMQAVMSGMYTSFKTILGV